MRRPLVTFDAGVSLRPYQLTTIAAHLGVPSGEVYLEALDGELVLVQIHVDEVDEAPEGPAPHVDSPVTPASLPPTRPPNETGFSRLPIDAWSLADLTTVATAYAAGGVGDVMDICEVSEEEAVGLIFRARVRKLLPEAVEATDDEPPADQPLPAEVVEPSDDLAAVADAYAAGGVHRVVEDCEVTKERAYRLTRKARVAGLIPPSAWPSRRTDPPAPPAEPARPVFPSGAGERRPFDHEAARAGAAAAL